MMPSSPIHPPSDTSTVLPANVRTAEPMILHGSDRFGKTDEVMPVYYPWDNATLIGEYHRAQTLHVELIERAAVESFAQFRHRKIEDRAAILMKLSCLIEANAEFIATLITQESGKPITLARVEVARAVQLCRDYAIEIERIEERLLRVDGRNVRMARFPVGPVLAITPYNFPLNLVAHKLCPAIAAGCSITIKPAPQTPLTALHLGRLAVEAGYEAISVVPAPNEVTEALVRSPAFAKLSFTGSAAIGWHLRSIAGTKSVTLELGGNAPLIIEEFPLPAINHARKSNHGEFNHAGEFENEEMTAQINEHTAEAQTAQATHDETEAAAQKALEALAKRVAFGGFAFAGQTCISVQRIFINERLKEAFMPAFVAATRAMKVGDPMRGDTDIGPMISIDAVRRTREMIKDALRAGANVVYGGNTYNALTMNPTILDRTTPEMAVNAEEAFAPIVTVTPYASFEDALSLANHSKYGLQAGLYTHNPAQIAKATQHLDVGTLLINDIPTYRHDRLPHGGTKSSGLGREGALSGIAEYSYLKTVVEKTLES